VVGKVEVKNERMQLFEVQHHPQRMQIKISNQHKIIFNQKKSKLTHQKRLILISSKRVNRNIATTSNSYNNIKKRWWSVNRNKTIRQQHKRLKVRLNKNQPRETSQAHPAKIKKRQREAHYNPIRNI
jgi:hypothetical protein